MQTTGTPRRRRPSVSQLEKLSGLQTNPYCAGGMLAQCSSNRVGVELHFPRQTNSQESAEKSLRVPLSRSRPARPDQGVAAFEREAQSDILHCFGIVGIGV